MFSNTAITGIKRVKVMGEMISEIWLDLVPDGLTDEFSFIKIFMIQL